MTVFQKALLAGVAAIGLSAPALAQESGGDFYSFGDSLSDPGNIPGLTGGFDFPPAPYAGNRFSNGPVWIELLPELLGLESSGDFAVGGAFTGQLATPSPLLVPVVGDTTGNINVISQAPTFNALFALDNSDTLSQVSGFVAGGGSLGATDFASVYAGGNDYFLASSLIAADPANAATIIGTSVTTAVTNIVGSATILAGAGAQNLIVPNLPNLGATPSSIEASIALGGDPTPIVLGTTISDAHNAALAGAMGDFAAASGVTVYLVDLDTVTGAVSANPSAFGFTNVTSQCLTTPTCVGGSAAVQDGFLFWDSVHPTAAGHRLIAAAAADTILAPRTIAAQGEVGADIALERQRSLSSTAATARRATRKGPIAWADYSYQSGEADGSFEALGHEHDASTYSIGAATRFSDAWFGGVQASATRGDAELSGLAAGFETDMMEVGAFLGHDIGRFSAVVQASVADNKYENISRFTGVGPLSTNANTSGRALAGSIEGRYTFGSEAFSFAPLGRLRAANVEVGGYTESGATGLNQLVFNRTIEPIDGEVGLEVAGEGPLSWRFEGAYVEPIEGYDQTVRTALVSAPEVVRVFDLSDDGSGYGRFGGSAELDLQGWLLQAGGEVLSGRDERDTWSAFGRVGKRF